MTQLKEREIERNRRYVIISNIILHSPISMPNFFDIRALNQKLQTENSHIASEQKCYQDYMNNVVFTNRPTSAYFNQFNTSSR